MVDPSRLIDLGCIIVAVFAFPNINEVWNNRHDLKGYSKLFILGMMCAVSSFSIGFFMMRQWIALIANIPPMINWLLVWRYMDK